MGGRIEPMMGANAPTQASVTDLAYSQGDLWQRDSSKWNMFWTSGDITRQKYPGQNKAQFTHVNASSQSFQRISAGHTYAHRGAGGSLRLTCLYNGPTGDAMLGFLYNTDPDLAEPDFFKSGATYREATTHTQITSAYTDTALTLEVPLKPGIMRWRPYVTFTNNLNDVFSSGMATVTNLSLRIAPAYFMEVRMFGDESIVPEGWIICDGRSIPTEYSELRAVVGTTAPNWDDRVPMGGGTVLATGGTDTIASANLPTHTHTLNSHTHTGTVNTTGSTHDHTINARYKQDTSTSASSSGVRVTDINELTPGGGTIVYPVVGPAGSDHTHGFSGGGPSNNNTSNGGFANNPFQPKHFRIVYAMFAGG